MKQTLPFEILLIANAETRYIRNHAAHGKKKRRKKRKRRRRRRRRKKK